MLDPEIFSPGLGTLSCLPREIRDRIYCLCLDAKEIVDESGCCDHGCTCGQEVMVTTPSFSLYLTSKQIYQESRICFFQTNEFCIFVNYDHYDRHNSTTEGQLGYLIQVGHSLLYRTMGCFAKIPHDMIPYMQLVHLVVGGPEGIFERDIMPNNTCRTLHGPDRPTFVPLLKAVEDACAMLKRCHHLHYLRVSVRSLEAKPGSIERVMDPIRRLRGIKHTKPIVYSMQEDRWVDWNLRGSYGRYMDTIMALPEGVEAPPYVGNERDPGRNDEDIFETVGARYMGGTSFSQDGDDFDDEGEYIDDDEYLERMTGNEEDDEDDDGFGYGFSSSHGEYNGLGGLNGPPANLLRELYEQYMAQHPDIAMGNVDNEDWNLD